MMAHALVTELASRTPDTLIGSCKSEDPGITCRLVWDISHSTYAAQLTRVYLAGPLNMAIKIAFVLLLAFVLRAITHRAINRLTGRAAQRHPATEVGSGRGLLPERSGEATWRLVAMTTPPRQYEVERALREEIKAALDARGITTVPTIVALAG
jgi:hypothetical protein